MSWRGLEFVRAVAVTVLKMGPAMRAAVLIAATAEKVCGWHSSAYGNWYDVPWSVEVEAFHCQATNDWNPLASIADAFMLVEAVRDRLAIQRESQTYTFQLHRTGRPGEWRCSFVVNHLDWSHQAMAEADTAARAITLAAIAAVEQEQNGN